MTQSNQVNQTNQTIQSNRLHLGNQVNKLHQVTHVNQTIQVDQVDHVIQVNHTNWVKQAEKVIQANQMNQVNQKRYHYSVVYLSVKKYMGKVSRKRETHFLSRFFTISPLDYWYLSVLTEFSLLTLNPNTIPYFLPKFGISKNRAYELN